MQNCLAYQIQPEKAKSHAFVCVQLLPKSSHFTLTNFLNGSLMISKILWLTKSNQRRRKPSVCVCVCVLSTQQTILLPFTKEDSVQSVAYPTREGSKQSAAYPTREGSKILRNPSRILRSLPMYDCHFGCIIANWARKKHWNAGRWIFF